jgi:AcrR family transcriptional regulator
MRRTAAEAAATRRDLLVAALAEFAELGYAAATLAGIAARAGVTRGALYHHFSDKGALFLSVLGELWAEAATPVWGPLDGPGPPLRRVSSFLVAFFTALERDATFREIFALSMRPVDGAPELAGGMAGKREVMEGWRRQLAALLADAPLRVPAEVAALAVISAANGAAATWLACPDLFSPAREAESLAEAIVHGFAA